MSYSVKEIFATLQGEGAQTGRASVFCRFSGCNLWTGREEDRSTAACQFCDTDFVGTDGLGGGKFANAEQLAQAITQCWHTYCGQDNGDTTSYRYVVFTGGEPLLQLDSPLIEAVKAHGFEVAVESNGTIAAPAGIDWLCISPKPGLPLLQKSGSELKLVYPQKTLPPTLFEGLDFSYFWLQPMDCPHHDEAGKAQHRENTCKTVQYCQQNPRWRLSVQSHKMIGIP